MTTFLYIADTHLGANPMGYQKQKGYPRKLPDMVRALSDYVSANRDVAFILHGGDMVDSATDENIAAASQLFDFPVPVYLCLGNHDLTTPDALERWLAIAPGFFPGRRSDYTIAAPDCAIHVAPNQWCEALYTWKDKQEAHLAQAQAAGLEEALNSRTDVPHFLLTHSPVYGLPPAQTGLAEPYHQPPAPFTEQIRAIAAKHPRLRCVLGAHNHMNMRVDHDGVEFVTVSAFVETPFEFKRFEVTPEGICMSTVALDSALPFNAAYDESLSFVQGRTVDRAFSRGARSPRVMT